jgi:hypothetical protein
VQINMDYYLIQRKEQEIDNDLANRLVEILTADLGILKIDAKLKINHFCGMLKVPDEKEALILSENFQKAGLDNFILEEKDLVPLPGREGLYSGMDVIDVNPDLIAAGKVYQEEEQTIRKYDTMDVRMSPLSPSLHSSGMKEYRKVIKQTTYYVDIITRKRRWGISKSAFPQKEVEGLKQFDLIKTYLSNDIRKIFNKQRDIKTFPERTYYNEYLTWLMQIVYAKH